MASLCQSDAVHLTVTSADPERTDFISKCQGATSAAREFVLKRLVMARERAFQQRHTDPSLDPLCIVSARCAFHCNCAYAAGAPPTESSAARRDEGAGAEAEADGDELDPTFASRKSAEQPQTMQSIRVRAICVTLDLDSLAVQLCS